MHMVDKQHCFMDINDFEQYEPFYNFQLSVKERALRFQAKFDLPLTSITRQFVNKEGVEETKYFVPKLEKTLIGIKLPDGRIIAHKEYKLFFDQNVRPERPLVETGHLKTLQITENGEAVGNNQFLKHKKKGAKTQLM